MTGKTFHPQGLTIPERCGIRRDIPRPINDRQAGYSDEYDDRTLFYDVHQVADRLYLSGPPLMNFSELIRSSRLQVDGADVSVGLIADGKKATRSWLQVPQSGGYESLKPPRSLSVSNSYFDAEIRISSDESKLLAGRRVLSTLSKDNRLEWITEWVQFYVDHHGTDAVLIYDNASTSYTCRDLLDAVASVTGILQAIIVDWPYPYGPGCGPSGTWDSDYCQYGYLENARWRFLRDASGVISCDIDELTLSSRGTSLYEAAEASPVGVVNFSGSWIDAVRSDPTNSRYPIFGSYIFADTTTERTEQKWAAVPSRVPAAAQWFVHDIEGVYEEPSAEFSYRHFRGISNGWKRSARLARFDPTVHRVDRGWLAASAM